MKNEYMKIAIEQAKKAYKTNNTPVGCVIVFKNSIIAKSYNKKNSKNNAIYHAEILSIFKACKKLKSWYLNECEMYVTLKPCNMCYGAINEARISKVYYILDSNYYMNMNYNIGDNIYVKVDDKFQYSTLLSTFFKNKRNL